MSRAFFDEIDPDLLAQCGGTARTVRGGGEVLDFGWAPSDDPTYGGLAVPVQASENVPEADGDECLLWEYIKPALDVAGVKQLSLNWQLTGSCVHGGAMNALIFRVGLDIAIHRQAETFKYPFVLPAYGVSRSMIGLNREGEGSSGDTIAKALGAIGALPMDDPAVRHKPHMCGPAHVYNRDVELHYSAAGNSRPEQEAGKNYTLKFGIVTSADEAERELRRYRPLSFAGDWGGRMRPRLVDNMLINDHASRWNHQESVLATKRHKQLGRLFWVQNQWFQPGSDMEVRYIRTWTGTVIGEIVKPGTAVSVHGTPLNGEPPGGFWIQDDSMNYQCRRGEVRSFIEFKGYTDGNTSIGG